MSGIKGLYYIYCWTQEDLNNYINNHSDNTLLQDLKNGEYIPTYYGTITNVYNNEIIALKEYKAFLNICKRKSTYKIIGINDGFRWIKFDTIGE